MSLAATSSNAAAPVAKPRGDNRVLSYNPTGAYDKLPQDLLQDQQMPDAPLVACGSCGRKFREDRLQKHEAACTKLQDGSSRRGAFGNSVQRR